MASLASVSIRQEISTTVGKTDTPAPLPDSRVFAKALLHGCTQRGDGDHEIGTTVGTATAAYPLDFADQVLWYDIAIIDMILLCDFYEVCYPHRLASLCAGFITGRMVALLGERDRALDEGAACGVTWTIRLTGYPLLYDYCELDDIQTFASAMIDAIVCGAQAIDAPGTDTLRDQLVERFVHDVGREHGPHLEADKL